MFAKYLNQKQISDARQTNTDEQRGTRALALALKIEALKTQLARAESELVSIRGMRLRSAGKGKYEPSFQLMECAAYLARCADLNEVPTCKGGIDKLYQVTGAALSYALSDALYYEWVGKDARGALFWRDAGLSDECPMVAIAKQREDQRKARAAK